MKRTRGGFTEKQLKLKTNRELATKTLKARLGRNPSQRDVMTLITVRRDPDHTRSEEGFIQTLLERDRINPPRIREPRRYVPGSQKMKAVKLNNGSKKSNNGSKRPNKPNNKTRKLRNIRNTRNTKPVALPVPEARQEPMPVPEQEPRPEPTPLPLSETPKIVIGSQDPEEAPLSPYKG